MMSTVIGYTIPVKSHGFAEGLTILAMTSRPHADCNFSRISIKTKFTKTRQVSDWRSQFNKPTLLTSLIAYQACSASAVVTVFKTTYVIGK